MSIEDITNPLQYIECVIAFDSRDWAEDNRLATIYAIVFGWGGDDDNDIDAWPEMKEKFRWSNAGVERLKKFHEEWKRLRKDACLPAYIIKKSKSEGIAFGEPYSSDMYKGAYYVDPKDHKIKKIK